MDQHKRACISGGARVARPHTALAERRAERFLKGHCLLFLYKIRRRQVDSSWGIRCLGRNPSSWLSARLKRQMELPSAQLKMRTSCGGSARDSWDRRSACSTSRPVPPSPLLSLAGLERLGGEAIMRLRGISSTRGIMLRGLSPKTASCVPNWLHELPQTAHLNEYGVSNCSEQMSTNTWSLRIDRESSRFLLENK